MAVEPFSFALLAEFTAARSSLARFTVSQAWSMEFVPLGAPLSFGAEVRSAHPLPLGALSPKDVATLRAALLEHQLLIFRDQRELDPADQAAFAKEFAKEEFAKEERLSNGASQPTALEWHTCALTSPLAVAAL